VDNCAASFINQLDNGIHVPTFYGRQDDFELAAVTTFLLKVSTESDVRNKMRQTFFMSELYQLYLTDMAS